MRLLRLRFSVALTTTLMALPAAAARAQAPAGLPRFAVQPSPIGLRGDVRPGQYLGVVGPRSAWLGLETGEAELWVHPLKLASGFHLRFKIPEYALAVPGRDLARTVEVRPEAATITYSHATFTVRQHVIAPLDEPGLLVLLEVDSYRPLEIEVSFRTVLQYAWPAGLGGQYAFWSGEDHAFVLSESLRRRNAVIGSPWASGGSEHPAHALPDAPSVFTIPVDPARASRELIPIAIAAATAPREEVLAAYRRLVARAPEIYEARRRRADELRERSLSVRTPEPRLDLAIEWAKADLDGQTVCNPDLGCGLVAGWGPSGEGARPGFGWYFGGDTAINSLAMAASGQWSEAADGLRLLARHQRADGKLPHEISQSAGLVPWFTEFPYTYSHADTTPFWLLALWQQWRASGDAKLLEELWPVAQKAWAWCVANDTDGDGIVENTSGGLGAVEVGAIGSEIRQDVYLAAVSARAAEAVADMAGFRGDTGLASEAGSRAARARGSIEARYWLEAAGHHSFGILTSGKVNDALTVWPATAAAFGLLEPAHAARTLRALASHRLSADWGARLLSTDNPLYDPTHYNMGAVWPFATGFLALGHYRYDRPWAGYPLIDALARTGFDWARGHHPEQLSGAYYRPLDTAVPQQFFSTSMLASAVAYGLLGWEPDAPRHRARLRPRLPPQWERMQAHSLAVGATRLDVEIEQRPGGLRVRLAPSGGPLRLDFEPVVPLRARDVRLRLDGSATMADASGALAVPLDAGPRTIDVSWAGGLAVEPPTVELRPGQADGGLRILAFEPAPHGWRLEVEGPAGEDARLRLHGHVTSADGARLRSAGDVTDAVVSLPRTGGPFARAVVLLHE